MFLSKPFLRTNYDMIYSDQKPMEAEAGVKMILKAEILKG